MIDLIRGLILFFTEHDNVNFYPLFQKVCVILSVLVFILKNLSVVRDYLLFCEVTLVLKILYKLRTVFY